MPSAPKGDPVNLRRIVPLADIRTDSSSQARARIRPAVVREYAAAMRSQLAEGNLCFPPVVLFVDLHDYWLGDGFHRVLAARQAGQSGILAEVHRGTQRDALLYSISSNSDHGLPRSKADKRRAVTLLLDDAEWRQWNDYEIARLCQVSHGFVWKMRKLGEVDKGASSHVTRCAPRKVRRGNQVYEMQPRQPGGRGTEPPEPLGLEPRLEPAEAGTPTPAESKPQASSPTPLDGLGLPVPVEMAAIFASVADFQVAKDLYNQLAALIDRLARQPGGAVLRPQLARKAENGQESWVWAELEASAPKLLAAAPYSSCCPLCYLAHPGFSHPDCKLCRGQGWTTQTAFESCPENYRQQMLQALGVRRFELVA
jgi:hypothetical protein